MNFKTSEISQSFQTGIFSELADYKMKKLNQGIEMIDLSIGSPDLAPPSFIVEELITNCKDPKQYGYTLKGLHEFYEAVGQFYNRHYDVQLDTNKEVLQLIGSQEGLTHLPMVYLNKGDLILVPDPGYPAYEAGVNLAGAKMYPMALKKENRFLPNLDEIPEHVAKQAKMMVLNFPGNPVPALATYEFFEKVVAFAKKYEILVVHDFAYSELVYDGKKAVSFLSVEGAMDVGVEFNSLSKSFNMAGCRIAYVVGNAKVIEALGCLKSNLDYGVFSPIQKAATKALQLGDSFLLENRKIYEERRNVLVKGLNDIGWKVESPEASMFMWSEIPSGYTSKQFVYELMDRAGVVVTPGQAFGKYGEGFVRMALVQEPSLLDKAVKQISKSGIFNN